MPLRTPFGSHAAAARLLDAVMFADIKEPIVRATARAETSSLAAPIVDRRLCRCEFNLDLIGREEGRLYVRLVPLRQQREPEFHFCCPALNWCAFKPPFLGRLDSSLT